MRDTLNTVSLCIHTYIYTHERYIYIVEYINTVFYEFFNYA